MSSYRLCIILSTCSCISLLLNITSATLASFISALFTLTLSLIVLNSRSSMDLSFHCLNNLIALLYFSSSVTFLESSYSCCTDFGSISLRFFLSCVSILSFSNGVVKNLNKVGCSILKLSLIGGITAAHCLLSSCSLGNLQFIFSLTARDKMSASTLTDPGT